MSVRGLSIAVLLSAGLTGCVTAATSRDAVETDMLTISGREAMKTASPGSPLAEKLVLADVIISDAAAATLNLEPAVLRSNLKQAFARSLTNHGYGARGDAVADAVPLIIEIANPVLTTDPEATTAVVDMIFRVPGDAAQASCLSHASQTRFRAVERLKSGGGERATALAAVVLMAAVGVNGGVFMADQFRNADADNAALNARRTLAAGEGLTPIDYRSSQYASVHAVRLGMAQYIRHLGEAPVCTPPRRIDIPVGRLPGF